MVDVTGRKCTCAHPGCTKQPSFNVLGCKAKFCAEHKEIGMVNVKTKHCEHPGCTKQPNFNVLGNKPKFCAEHKEGGMVDVTGKRCEHLGCTKHPSFNVLGSKAKFCASHKERGMVDVVSKKCEHPGCMKHPSFNVLGCKAKFCASHKEDGMIDVTNKKCEHPGCMKHAHYRASGTVAAIRFCFIHKGCSIGQNGGMRHGKRDGTRGSAPHVDDQQHASGSGCHHLPLPQRASAKPWRGSTDKNLSLHVPGIGAAASSDSPLRSQGSPGLDDRKRQRVCFVYMSYLLLLCALWTHIFSL